MKTPSNQALEKQFAPGRPKDLPMEALTRLREHSKRMFGNQDRLEVAVAIARIELGKVNATDLHREVDVAVNRIRAQLLALEGLGLLARIGDENGKRMFQRCHDEDRFWAFALGEFEDVLHDTAASRP